MHLRIAGPLPQPSPQRGRASQATVMTLDKEPTFWEEPACEKRASRLVVGTSAPPLGVRLTVPEVPLERVAGLPDVVPKSHTRALLLAAEVPREVTRLPGDGCEVVHKSVSPP